jgi:hypothetical protein
MRQTTVILAGICLAGGLAMADSLTINKVQYPNVRVTDASNGRIAYELNGRTYDKPLSDVSYVMLDGQRDFNKAEDAFKAGKFAEAVAAYTETEKSAGKLDWLRRLVRYRRMPAAVAAKMPGQAIADWLGIIDDESGAGRVAIVATPVAVAPKGSPENARAIELLEERVGAKGDVVFRAKVKDLLLKLYETEGLKDKELKLLGLAAGAPPASGPAGNGGERAPGTMGGSVKRVSIGLEEAASLIKLGQYDAAAESIKSKLSMFTTSELPGALVLRGKALQLSYEKGGAKDVEKLKEAGLCFMRVAVCFDASTPQVPEALYLGAMVERALGNEVAAAKALRMLVDQHVASEWAQKAKAALAGPAAPKKEAREPGPTTSTR